MKLKEFVIDNGSKIKSDGVWSPDYIDVLKQLDNEIHDINNELDNINHKIDIINQTLVSYQNQINDINIIINQMIDTIKDTKIQIIIIAQPMPATILICFDFLFLIFSSMPVV